jgi:hypothetical protein
MRFQTKIQTNMENEARGSPECENGAQGRAKVNPGAPKGSQNQPKQNQKGAKGDPNGAKREPKVDPIQHEINMKDKVAKTIDFW